LAITRVSGLTTNPGAKAFAPHQQKTHKRLANNAAHTGASLRASGGRRPRSAALGYESLVYSSRFLSFTL